MSKLQTICGKATIKDLKIANKVLELPLETWTEALCHKARAISCDDAIVAAITDASFGKEIEEVNVNGLARKAEVGKAMCDALDHRTWLIYRLLQIT